MVATDRISAFDYVLGSGIPDKGKVLTQLSAFWFARTTGIVPNHLLSTDVREYPEPLRRHGDILHGRSMLVRKTAPVPIECVARGYLSGSGWKEYVATGSVCGIALPGGLRESDRLPRRSSRPPRKPTADTTSTSAKQEAGRLVGVDLVSRLRELTLALYDHGARHAEANGIILADTKFEFGLMADNSILLIDEVMTPDSSRYWPRGSIRAGPPATELRQAVRPRLPGADPLEQAAAGPFLPEHVVMGTRDKRSRPFTGSTGK